VKLSEIKGERVFDVIADIIDPITSIALDEEAKKFFERRQCPDDMSGWEFFLTRLKESLPTLVRTHKHDLCVIMATMENVSVEEYVENMTLPSLVSDLVELLTDQEFASFFA
jgi:hypothetical protein